MPRVVRRPRPPRRQARLSLPTRALRVRRGPSPPDHVIAALEAALARELGRTDADEDDIPVPAESDLSPGWWAALTAALLDITRHARRGVSRALPAGVFRDLANSHPVVPSLTWGRALTARVLAGLRGSLAGALQALAEAVLGEHTRVVGVIARAAGSRRYAWTSRDDEHVRQLHVELDGTVQLWSAPPVSGTNGFRGHPGEPAGPCRCQAWPILG